MLKSSKHFCLCKIPCDITSAYLTVIIKLVCTCIQAKTILLELYFISIFDQLVSRIRATFGHKTWLIVRASLRDLSS